MRCYHQAEINTYLLLNMYTSTNNKINNNLKTVVQTKNTNKYMYNQLISFITYPLSRTMKWAFLFIISFAYVSFWSSARSDILITICDFLRDDKYQFQRTFTYITKIHNTELFSFRDNFYMHSWWYNKWQKLM